MIQTSDTRPSADPRGRQPFGLGSEVDAFHEPYLSDPYAFSARARREEPVFHSPTLESWVVARYEDVRRVVTDQ